MKHIISCDQFERKDLDRLCSIADDMIANPEKYSESLKGKVIATMFFEPSTRTRLSFESAIQRLGAKNISTENAREASSATKGETIEDTIRVISGYTDGIVMRHYDKDAAARAAAVATVPVFNAGSGSGSHPTQALLDIFTIHRCHIPFEHLTIAFIGDLLFGRTVHSLIKLLRLYDHVIIYGLPARNFDLPEEYKEYMRIHNITYIPCESIEDIPADVDVLYQTRTQQERFTDSDLAPKCIVINKKVLDRFSDHTILMHPLPRNEEISTDVDDDPRAMFFTQAHNGMWMRMALLYDTILYPDR